jgi:hypothetical protein
MPTIELTDNELRSIDLACMVLLENVRRGRQFQSDAAADGDLDVAEWYGESVRRTSEAGVSLRAILHRHKEAAVGGALPKSATCNACGEDVLFDAYADINGEVRCVFPEWTCSACDNAGKYQESNNGYTIKETK